MKGWSVWEWWLFITIAAWFVVAGVMELVERAPGWIRRLERLQRGRAQQQAEYTERGGFAPWRDNGN